MNGLWMIAEGFVPRVAKPLPTGERFRALRGIFPGGADSSWFWTVVLVVVISLVVLGVLIHLARRHARIRAAWESFGRLAGEASLNDEERSLLAVIARLGGLRARPDTVFTTQRAFDAGLTRLSQGRRRGGADSGRRGALCATCSYLVSLREKLGFELAGDAERPGAIRLGHLEPGTTLTVYRQTKPENLQVFVTGHRGQGRELLVLPEIPLEARVGETWAVRYPQGGMLWEFDAWVVSNMADEIAIRPGGGARWINRRRFARVPARHPAHVAHFPFQKAEKDMGSPEFVPAHLVEIGGPGLRLEAPLEAAIGDRLLVMAKLPSCVVETVGTVRHVRRAEGGVREIALELTGLDTSQIAELIRVTNELARSGEGSKEAAPVGAYPREGPDG